jgi:16S rRNA (guanine966-N2)-methyltransferase
VRVVGGRLKGRAIKSPQDARVRPTSDRVREAVFNILAHNDFGAWELEGAKVLDLFAGTGALSAEALSRGARLAVLVDDDPDSRALIRENLEALGLNGVAKIWKRDASMLGPCPAQANGPFDLVFCDPPYRKGLAEPALASALAGGWIVPGAVIVLETAADEAPVAISGLVEAGTRIYGETRITVLTAPA